MNEDLNGNARGWCDSSTKEPNGFSSSDEGSMVDDVAVAEDGIVGVDGGGPVVMCHPRDM